MWKCLKRKVFVFGFVVAMFFSVFFSLGERRAKYASPSFSCMNVNPCSIRSVICCCVCATLHVKFSSSSNCISCV